MPKSMRHRVADLFGAETGKALGTFHPSEVEARTYAFELHKVRQETAKRLLVRSSGEFEVL